MKKPTSELEIRVARLVSFLFYPLWLPLVVSGYAAFRLEVDAIQILWVIAIGSLFFAFVPWIILIRFKQMKKIESIDIRDRVSRNMPFSLGLLSMGCGLIAYQYAPLNHNLIYMILSIISINNTMVAALINLKWKISVHSMGMGTAITVLFFLSGSFPLQWPDLSVASALYVFLGVGILILVQYSRVKLVIHTPAQVIVGGMLSIILTIGQLTLFISKTPTAIMV